MEEPNRAPLTVQQGPLLPASALPFGPSSPRPPPCHFSKSYKGSEETLVPVQGLESGYKSTQCEVSHGRSRLHIYLNCGIFSQHIQMQRVAGGLLAGNNELWQGTPRKNAAFRI